MATAAKPKDDNPDLMPEKPIPQYAKERNELLKDIPFATIRKAWFTLAHILVDDGAHVVDTGCGDGAMSYAMAVLNPKIKITAVDRNKRQISRAKEIYNRPNLTFMAADATGAFMPENSVDVIINSFVLHEVYSGSRYNERIVSDMLEQQFRMLKIDGMMYIRDYARPPPEEFVLLEMKDQASRGNKLSDMSEVDLLLWYSEHARPRQDPGCGGFFLEELPPRIPRTRLFRLPYKWAYEFIMRKDDRDRWETELPMEYTFFTMREFRKELRSLGARVEYSAPHWDEDMIEKNFDGHFRLFEDNGTPIGDPATSFIAVARKMSERKSLYIEERRPSQSEDGSLRVFAMRDEKSGKLLDLVTRDKEFAEILPYRIDEDGRLKIFLHYGVARGIANAVARSGVNIDGKRWSGHMVEPIAVDLDIMSDMDEFNAKNSALFARDYLGLKPYSNAVLEHGTDFYPAPDFIDERMHTYYLNVVSPQRSITPKSTIGNTGGFQARGQIRELDAQQVLNAITIGFIPNARLELQIMALFQQLDIQAETWTNKEVAIKAGKISSKIELRTILRQLQESSNRFKQVKGTAGQLRTVHSLFVEEGQSQGGVTGLSAQDIDFAIANDKTINVAVVLPITAGLKKDFHAGLMLNHLPVPQRHEGKSATASAPSFELPPEITNYRLAKKFIAERFGVLPEMVFKLGESYFSHIGMSPQKIHPFGVAAPPDFYKDTDITFFPMNNFHRMWPMLKRDTHMMLTIGRAYKYMHSYVKSQMKRESLAELDEIFSEKTPEWGYPEHFISAPTGKATPDATAQTDTKTPAPVSAPSDENVSEPVAAETVPTSQPSAQDTAKPKPERW